MLGVEPVDPLREFAAERALQIKSIRNDEAFNKLSHDWTIASAERRYFYNFDWLGRPIIQYPQDIVAVQEIIWRTKPDLIIETGIAHGGSLALSASMLALLDLADGKNLQTQEPLGSRRMVLGIDIDVRPHNRSALEKHPLAPWMEFLEGSSTSQNIVNQVREIAKPYPKVMVLLDSMHTHDHVLAELEAYGDLVSPGNYLVVFDTFVEDLPADFYPDRPWTVGDNQRMALNQWLKSNHDFEVDLEMDAKLQISVAHAGYLLRK
jgi:cephalosporin hydroxylase